MIEKLNYLVYNILIKQLIVIITPLIRFLLIIILQLIIIKKSDKSKSRRFLGNIADYGISEIENEYYNRIHTMNYECSYQKTIGMFLLSLHF